MDWPIKIQGRLITEADVNTIRLLIHENLQWNRTRLSRELCRLWHWQRPDGQIKDMACRELLRKLESRKLITLPPRQGTGSKKAPIIDSVVFDKTPVSALLSDIQPIKMLNARDCPKLENTFNYILKEYHYLGFSRTVGQNMKYLITGANDQIPGCLLFGAAAWKTTPRDQWIGWSPKIREQNLGMLCNNTRFLILDWIRVPNLASHVLGTCLRRLSQDWLLRYGSEIALVETFVDTTRYPGTCYKAANWIKVGQTKGRGRQDRNRTLNTSVKDVLIYPLRHNYRQILHTEKTM